LHRAQELVTDRQPAAHRQIAVVEVHVRTADGSGVHRDDGAVCARQGRIGGFDHLDAARTIDDDVEHGSP
jgi:hypothetical protein